MSKKSDEQKASQKKRGQKSASGKVKKKLPLSPIAIVDNIVYSKKSAWAYYEIPNNVYDFLSRDGQINLGQAISNSFQILMSDRTDPLECHLISTMIPVDIEAWEIQVREVAQNWEPGPGFEKYLREQMAYLNHRKFTKRVALLGINLGVRGALDMSEMNPFESGAKGAINSVKEWIDSFINVPGEVITVEEEESSRNKESKFYLSLSKGNLQAVRCTSEELLLTIKRQFYPAMPSPYLDVDVDNRVGPGDIELESASAIERKYRWLRISQIEPESGIEMGGYRAVMTIAGTPREMTFPDSFPFFYMAPRMGFPFTCYARFNLIPNAKMKQKIESKRAEQADEIKNLKVGRTDVDSAIDGGNPADVDASLRDLHLATEITSSDTAPWVTGYYRIVVEAASEQYLADFCSELKQSYDNQGINLRWSSGDQLDLFLEQMPGDEMRGKSFDQITNLNMIAGSGFNFASDVGDDIKEITYGADD